MRSIVTDPAPRAAEFFAGIGLVRMALEREGFRVVFANDISETKRRLYAANFDAAHYLLADIRTLSAEDVPDIDLAIASFPCTDVSLAGSRAGLRGDQSGMFWEFARIIGEMGSRRPPVVFLENVAGLSSSGGGSDLRAAISRLNSLGYWCDAFTVDARWFVPQSRPRLFVVGSLASVSTRPNLTRLGGRLLSAADPLRPEWLHRFAAANADLRLQALPLDAPTPTNITLDAVVERFPADDVRWWDERRLGAFTESLSLINRQRVAQLRGTPTLTWRTAYRRTRSSRPVWEIRPDAISGCLRTARGGSSKQAVVEAGNGVLRARWMTPREYARLQGAPDFRIDIVTPSQALFGFGDAVCVPVIQWIAQNYLVPLVRGELATTMEAVAG